jgi:hypothetical protein
MENRGKQLANDLTNFVNNYNHKPEDFINSFVNEHRTLQQSSFRLILMLIEKMASDEYRTDGRNEQSKNIAKKLIDGFKNEIIKEEIAMGSTEEAAIKYVNSPYVKPHKYLSTI